MIPSIWWAEKPQNSRFGHAICDDSQYGILPLFSRGILRVPDSQRLLIGIILGATHQEDAQYDASVSILISTLCHWADEAGTVVAVPF